MMRAKMKVVNKVIHESGGPDGEGCEELEFSAVAASNYPSDGSDENNTFAKWTPTATLKMSVVNPALFGKISIGQQFYVDFTLAE